MKVTILTKILFCIFHALLAANIDISPEQSNVFIEGEASNFTCVNPSPPDWSSVQITVKSPSEEVITLTLRTVSPCAFSISNTTSVGGVLYWCDYSKFVVTVLNPRDSMNNMTMACSIQESGGTPISKDSSVAIHVKISAATITSNYDSNIVNVVSKDAVNITCTTDAGRPAAWIQWYVGGRNVTTLAFPQTPQSVGDKFISSSVLMYTGNDADHDTDVRCEALNIEGLLPVTSLAKKKLYIKVKIGLVTISSTVSDNNIYVVSGERKTITCKTDAGRPAAWIQWYIGERNVTDQATPQTPQSDGAKFISSSVLNYTGLEMDHQNSIFCEAVNIEEMQRVRSQTKTIFIEVQVSTVTMTQTNDSSIVIIVSGETVSLTCITDAGRPVARIQWYIGGRNVTSLAVPQPPQVVGDKFISSSVLMYTGNDYDHDKDVHCEAVNIEERRTVKSLKKKLYIKVKIYNVNIISASTDNHIKVVSGENKTLTCTTDAGRPAAWIQWYIGGRNVTNQATPQTPQRVGTKFISSSILTYTGLESDHQNNVYCEAVNIDRQAVRSQNRTVYIQQPVSSVYISPKGSNRTTVVVSDKTNNLTCSTSSSRPAATVHWFIGQRNVTDLAKTTITDVGNAQYETTSYLMYTGQDQDHNRAVWCEAINIEGRQKVKSTEINIFVLVPVKSIEVSPKDQGNAIIVVADDVKNFTCTTGSSRPDAFIHWNVGGQNVTGQAILQPPQIAIDDNTKFISSSIFGYTGSMNDHNHIITCSAYNVMGMNIVNATGEILTIHSQPLFDSSHPMTDYIGIKQNEGLNISLFLIANPKPTVTWKYHSISSNINVTKTGNLITRDEFHHVSSFAKTEVSENDYGTYYININNGVGLDLLHTVIVGPQQPPHVPYLLSADCSETTSNVSWISNFNGGDEQSFTVSWLNKKGHTIATSYAIPEKGRDIRHFAFQDKLSPATTYNIFITAKNKHGNVNSSYINCTTDENEKIPLSTKEPLSFEAGMGAGLGIAVFVGVVAVVLYHLMERFKNTHNTKKDVYESTQLDTSQRNLYNELGEINLGSAMQDSSDTRNQYEELDSEAQRKFKRPKVYENTKIPTKGTPVNIKHDNTYDNLKV